MAGIAVCRESGPSLHQLCVRDDNDTDTNSCSSMMVMDTSSSAASLQHHTAAGAAAAESSQTSSDTGYQSHIMMHTSCSNTHTTPLAALHDTGAGQLSTTGPLALHDIGASHISTTGTMLPYIQHHSAVGLGRTGDDL